MIVLFALGALFGFIRPAIGKAQENLSKRLGQRGEIDRLRKTPVEIPPENPDDDYDVRVVTVNKASIKQLSEVFKQMNNEYSQMFEFAVNINRRGHQEMIPSLFPDTTQTYIVHDAKDAYREAFVTMLGPYSPDASLPCLNAGEPTSPLLIEEVKKRISDEYMAEHLNLSDKGVESLSSSERDSLMQLIQTKLIDLLQRDAEKIHLYVDKANVDSHRPDEFFWDQFPFDLGQWCSPEVDRPSLGEVWEGQLGLWIQQDIVEAIARTNQVDNPLANVMNTPVKRLIKIKLGPGYVGINGNSGLDMSPSEGRPKSRTSSRRFSQAMPPNPFVGGGPGLLPPMGGPSVYDRSGYQSSSRWDPSDDDRPTSRPGGAEEENFSISHTGRQSNDLYDVRHVWVSLVIDSQHLSEFFNNLQAINFITVLKVEFRNVDEYESLAMGYFYGQGDAVEADILLETIWLRNWTADLMPKEVRRLVGIDAPLGSDEEDEEYEEDE